MKDEQTAQQKAQNDLKVAEELIYNKCKLTIANFRMNDEGKEYSASSFELSGKRIQYRNSKITPTKSGQFVAIWKRNKHGQTAPFDILDDFDYYIISCRKEFCFGQFIFPKSILSEKGIISTNDKTGKRGIRVYPPWDKAENKTAVQTQNWQTKYFVNIYPEKSIDLLLVKRILQ